MSILNLQAILQQDGSLTIAPNGGIPVSVVFSDTDQGRIATIAFGGFNQAVVTFDLTGTRPLTYHLYSPMPTAALDRSIQNIVNHMSGSPTLH